VKYRIELTEQQMRVLENCTNLYMRVLMGQTWDLADLLCERILDRYDKDSPDNKIIFERYITKRYAIIEVLNSVVRIARDTQYGFPAEKSEDGMIAECIWDAIRVARGTSRYGEVLPIGSEPVPKIDAMKEEEQGKDKK
jgi:hypothetical protein